MNTNTATPEIENSYESATVIFEAGSLLNRVYEIQRVLGRGNTGVVYLCRHTILEDRLMAVKILDPFVAADRVTRQRFIDEIRATYDVAHPNIIRTFEYFEDNGVCGLAMEHVEGGDLLDLIEKTKPMSFDLIRGLLKQVCAGLSAIHAKGIVHRDIKPENILVTKDFQIKIADFGIASLGGRSRATVAGNLVGALDYLSPEYINSGEFDLRSDLYAVGALAFTMISGRSPFEGLNLHDSLARRVSAEADDVTRFRPDCPPDLAKAVAKALRRNPVDRHQTASELFNDLDQRALQSFERRVSLQTKPDPVRPRSHLFQRSTGRIFPQSRFRSFLTCSMWLLLLGALDRGYIDLGKNVFASGRDLLSAPIRPGDPDSNFHHTVRYRGESLSIIASWYTGNKENWLRLAQANPNLNPNLISVGQKLTIPADMLIRSETLPPEYLEKFQPKAIVSDQIN